MDEKRKGGGTRERGRGEKCQPRRNFLISLECAKVSQIAEVQGERVPGIRTRGTESCTRQRTSKGRLPEEETTLGTQANGSTAGGGRREHGL